MSASPTYRLVTVGFLGWNLAAHQWFIAALAAPSALMSLFDTACDEFLTEQPAAFGEHEETKPK